MQVAVMAMMVSSSSNLILNLAEVLSIHSFDGGGRGELKLVGVVRVIEVQRRSAPP